MAVVSEPIVAIRARRLLPAALVALTGVAALSRMLVFSDQLESLRGDLLSALFYVANWRFYLRGDSYSDIFGAPSPVLHFWSLSIEEQFYVAFPLIAVAALAAGGLRSMRLVFGILVVASLGAALLITGPDRSYYGSDTRMFEILLGLVLALWHRSNATRWNKLARRLSFPALALCLGAMAMLTTFNDATSSWAIPGFAVLSGVLTLAAAPRGALIRLVSARPLVYLGKVSYGVYLYHWPIFSIFTEARLGTSGWSLLAVRSLITLAIAVFSYHLIEMPVRRPW